MWTRMKMWLKTNWFWLVPVVIAVLYLGLRVGWWLAGLLGGGAAAGGAVKALTENQKRREAEARELEQRYQDLAGEAKKTDQMYEDYKRRRNQR
jgi:hypothetical protein